MCILLDGAHDGQVTAVDAATEMVPGALSPATATDPAAHQLDGSAEGAQTPDLPPGMPPPEVVAGALALNSAQSLAHSILSRAVFLADAPAATLATPYALRRAGRQLAMDSAALCHALDGIRAFILAIVDAQAATLAQMGEALDAASALLDEMGAGQLAAEQLAAGDTESEGVPHAS